MNFGPATYGPKNAPGKHSSPHQATPPPSTLGPSALLGPALSALHFGHGSGSLLR